MASPRTAAARRGEIRFKQESTAGEAIANPTTYWAASPKKVKAWDAVPNIGQKSEANPSLALHPLEHLPNIMLQKVPSLGFKAHLAGLDQTATNSVAVTQDDLGLLLKAWLGGQTLGTTTTVDGANTGAGATAALKVTSAAGLSVGQMIYVVATGEARVIVAKATNDLTLDMDLSSAPTSGLVVAAETTYPDSAILADMSHASRIYLAALFRGDDVEDQHQFRGCCVGAELSNIGPSKPAMLDVTMYPLDAEMLSSAAVAAGTPFAAPIPAPQIGAASGLYLTSVGTTRVVEHTRSIDIKLGIKPEPYESPAGVQGVAGHAAFGGQTTIEFEAPYDQRWSDFYTAVTPLIAGYLIGTCTTKAGAVGISFGRTYIDDYPERVGGQSYTGAKVKMHADLRAVTTNDLTQARFAIHRFPHL